MVRLAVAGGDQMMRWPVGVEASVRAELGRHRREPARQSLRGGNESRRRGREWPRAIQIAVRELVANRGRPDPSR
jgi:hypothetical protein